VIVLGNSRHKCLGGSVSPPLTLKILGKSSWQVETNLTLCFNSYCAKAHFHSQLPYMVSSHLEKTHDTSKVANTHNRMSENFFQTETLFLSVPHTLKV
jgi:hypothetical protein